MPTERTRRHAMARQAAAGLPAPEELLAHGFALGFVALALLLL